MLIKVLLLETACRGKIESEKAKVRAKLTASGRSTKSAGPLLRDAQINTAIDFFCQRFPTLKKAS